MQNYHSMRHKYSPFAPLHFHSAIEFLFVQRGTALARINGEDHVIHTGEGCFVDRFCIHAHSNLEDNTEIYVFVGNSALFEPLFSDVGGVPPTVFPFDDFAFLDMAIKYYTAAKNEAFRLTVFKGAVAFLLSRIAQNTPLLTTLDRVSSEDICAILHYINEHYAEPLSLRSLSREFGYSPQYFSKLFHKYMRINLTEYVNIARVNQAKRLLESKKSIAEIAFECGFGSTPSFYRAYKKVFGSLPRG